MRSAHTLEIFILKNRYFIGMAIATVVLLSNQAFIQYWLSQKKFDANLINRSGKQRMLSQRINLEFFKWNSGDGNPELIRELYSEWKAAHYAFFTGSEKLELKAVENPQAIKLLDELTVNVEMIGLQLKLLRKPTDNELTVIGENQLTFLEEMDVIVSILEEDSERKLAMIVFIEILLMFISLTIIVLEVLFIFMPIEKKLSRSNAQLELRNTQLKRSIDEVELKNQELERFTFVAAHDLREPLVTVKSFIDLFETEYADKLDGRASNYFRFIGESVERMDKLVRALLKLSLIGHEKNYTLVNLNQVIEHVRADLSEVIRQSSAQIIVDELPVLEGDETEFGLLFQNLISNGIKFRKPNSKPTIRISAEWKNEEWQFLVADNGVGIDEKSKEKVFNIFFRLHKRSKYEGTGIGLALCRKVINQYGGRIWVDSALNRGANFYFTLPA